MQGIGDVKFRLFHGPYVCRMGLIQEDGQLAEHRAGSRNFGDLHPVLDDLDRTALENQKSPRARSGSQHVLAG
jgi:hypothetical protein